MISETMIACLIALVNLMAESEEELKSLLMKVEEESEKVGLKLNIQINMLGNYKRQPGLR